MKQTLALLSAAVLAAALCACPEPAAEDPAAPVWNYPPASLEEAQQRIEYYRMDDIEFVVTKDGQAVAGADVKVEMLNHEFLFGGGLLSFNRNQNFTPDSAWARSFTEIFNYATLWHQWEQDEPRQGGPNYDSLFEAAAFCAEKGIKPKTGALMPGGNPLWLNSAALNDEQRLQLAYAHVKRDVETLQGKIDIFDVFNEWENMEGTSNAAKRFDETAGGMSALVIESFRVAKEAGNPNARFIINDNNFTFSEGYSRLVKDVIDAGCQLDAIGMQTHMHTGWWNSADAWNLAQKLSQFGKPVHFTELTILSNPWVGGPPWDDGGMPPDLPTTPEGEEGQKRVAIQTYYEWFSHPAVEAITWWDFTDRESWYNEPAGLIRADMSPKPAYDALKKLIWETWATNETVTTGADGKARLRAYRGEYRFTVTLSDGTNKTFTGTVKKNGGPITLEMNV
jgi:GH35 family endo-1,4-beta-xylanase